MVSRDICLECSDGAKPASESEIQRSVRGSNYLRDADRRGSPLVQGDVGTAAAIGTNTIPPAGASVDMNGLYYRRWLRHSALNAGFALSSILFFFQRWRER